jgi:hypothetical protein
MEYRAPELCEMASDWLARTYPGSLIVRELSVGDWGGAQLDVAAITETHIVGVEIKGEGDSLTRLRLQERLYSKAARHMFLLPTPSLALKLKKANRGLWPLLHVVDGQVRRVSKYATAPLPVAPRQLLQALCGKELKDLCKTLGCHDTKHTKVRQWTDAIIETAPLPLIEAEVCSRLRQRNWDWNGIVGERNGSGRTRWANA